MEAGIHVWCRDTKGDEAWILSEVIEKSVESLEVFFVKDPKIRIRLDREPMSDGTVRYKNVELANAPTSAEDRAAGIDDDLITLPHLHEPTLLHAVEERFMHNVIYTWTGPVLIGVNPFQRLKMYTNVSVVYSMVV